MMKTTTITGKGALAREFLRCCQAYSSLRIAAAWMGSPAHDLPFAYLEHVKGRLDATIGISFCHTHPDAIQRLLDAGSDIRIFNEKRGLFHPKIYFFSKGKSVALIIGSSNFTNSGFCENIEANILIEGVPAAKDSEWIKGIKASLCEWRSSQNSFVPTARWLQRYRVDYLNARKTEGKHKVPTPPRTEEQVSQASWLRDADWPTFYRKIDSAMAARGIRWARYENVLTAAERKLPIPWRTSYFDDLEKRRVAGGMYPYGSLGNVSASGKVRHLLANGTGDEKKLLVNAVNRVARMDTPIPWASLVRQLERLESLGLTMKVWGRFLCLARPDLFCTVASTHVRSNLAELLGVSQRSFETAGGYIELLKLIHASPWFNSEKPRQESQQRIWKYRAAALDAIFYAYRKKT